jgi:hypothetical protein
MPKPKTVTITVHITFRRNYRSFGGADDDYHPEWAIIWDTYRAKMARWFADYLCNLLPGYLFTVDIHWR